MPRRQAPAALAHGLRRSPSRPRCWNGGRRGCVRLQSLLRRDAPSFTLGYGVNDRYDDSRARRHYVATGPSVARRQSRIHRAAVSTRGPAGARPRLRTQSRDDVRIRRQRGCIRVRVNRGTRPHILIERPNVLVAYVPDTTMRRNAILSRRETRPPTLRLFTNADRTLLSLLR